MLTLLIALIASQGLPEPTYENYVERGECLWQAAPADARNTVEAADDKEAFNAAQKLLFESSAWSQMTEVCGMSEDDADYVAAQILGPYAYMRWQEPILENRWSSELLRHAFSRLNDEETGPIWGYFMGGAKQWPEERTILAQAALGKLYSPFGQSMGPPGQPSDLDRYLIAQLLISVLALDAKERNARDKSSSCSAC